MSESISIKIVSATYGPCEGIKLDTGESTNDEATRIPISRDVAPFLRALLSAARTREERYWTTVEGDLDVNDVIGNDMEEDEEDVGTDFPQIVRVQPTVGGMTKSSIFLLGGRLSMNSCFGDPCPGVSKRLQVHYVITEADVTEVHHSSFAEHERVILRRRVTFFQDDSQLKLAVEKAATNRNIMNNRSKLGDIMMMDSTENQRILQAHRMGRSQSIAEFESAITTKTIVVTPWRLRSAVSEIVLPLVLPFLKLHERVSCRLICRCWLHVVRDFGVAKTIDSNEQDFSRSFLRGILSHSHSSLDSLYLTRFESLQKEDLHPALPHLRKLRSLDITRCHNLDDSTMMLISKSVYQTLEVLYIKGLTKVSDVGFKAICSSCNKLEVLDMSYVPITDEGGKAIQQLKRLRALFLRDNYQLTNQSIDVITEKCTRLAQLTLWGCIRMQHLRVPSINSFKKLVILNLWGCHNLNDEASHSLNDMPNLKSLIVSECHRLTDRFVMNLAENVPHLNHLYMRYCKRLTDQSLTSITRGLHSLHSLDLSFCNKVSAKSIFNLLDVRFGSLSELRLKHCIQLDIFTTSQGPNQVSPGGSGGRLIANAIRSHPDHCLAVLDVRECGGQQDQFKEMDPFVIGLKAMDFDQRLPGYFSRPARVQRQLMGKVNSTQSIQ